MHAWPGSPYGDIECVFGMHWNKWMGFRTPSLVFLCFFFLLHSFWIKWVCSRDYRDEEANTVHTVYANARMENYWMDLFNFMQWNTDKGAFELNVYCELSNRQCPFMHVRLSGLVALKHTNATSLSLLIPPLITSVNRPPVHLFPLCYLGDNSLSSFSSLSS